MKETLYFVFVLGICAFGSCSYISQKLGISVQEEEKIAEEVVLEVVDVEIQMETGINPNLESLVK